MSNPKDTPTDSPVEDGMTDNHADAVLPDTDHTPPVAADKGGKFDLKSLRLTQDFAATLGVKKELLTVPKRKPTRHEFFQVHPDSSWQFQTAMLELKEEQELYLVDRPLWGDLAGEISPRLVVTWMNRQGHVGLWALRLPGEDGRIDEWSRSALEIAKMAQTRWVRMASSRPLGAYEVFSASVDLPPPVWPDIGFEQLLNLAFRDAFIRSADHPVLRKLRGEV